MQGDLRNKEVRQALKTPLRSVLVVVVSIVAFMIWLGVLVVLTKLLMG